MLKHPLFTYEDGTEVTASSAKDGKVRVFTEKWDVESDSFKNIEVLIPDGVIISNNV